MKISEMQLNEYFSMDYDMFGWIAPGGVVHLATPEQAAHPTKNYFHPQVAGDLGVGGYIKAWKAGYVRWLIEENELRLETNRSITPELIETVHKGVKSIEKLTKQPIKFGHFEGPKAKSKQPFEILYYKMEARNVEIYSESLSDLIRRMKLKLKKSETRRAN